MRITWDEIPASGLFFSIEDGSWVPGKEVTCQGPGMCTVSLIKKGERVLLAGTLRLPVVLECDRCLDSFAYNLAEEFEVFFELLAKEDAAAIGSDHFCKGSELDVVYLAEPSIDVFSVRGSGDGSFPLQPLWHAEPPLQQQRPHRPYFPAQARQPK